MMAGIICLELVVIWFLRKYFAGNFISLFMKLFGSKRGAIWIYAIVTLPGVLIHEIAHFLSAALMGLRTGNIELLPVLADSGGIEFGSVQVEKTDPFRMTLVGLAPLLAGLPLVAWMSLKIETNSLVWGYLIFSLTAHLLPSKKDMAYWPVTLGLIGLIVWLGAFQIKNSFLLESVIRGLLIPIVGLSVGTLVLFGLNLLFWKRIIVQ